MNKPYSNNKGADRLCGHTADLRLSFSHLQKNSLSHDMALMSRMASSEYLWLCRSVLVTPGTDVIKLFFKLNLAELEILTAHKYQILN